MPGRPRASGSRAVYRRRRLVAGILGLGVLLGLGAGVTALAGALGGQGGEGVPAASPSPTPTPTAAPTASATPGYQPGPCPSSALTITEPVPAPGTFAPGTPVPFELVLENTGTVPCLFDAGAAVLGVLVHSGTDRIWSSLDCPPDGAPAERRMLLDVAAQVEVTAVWDQQRSAPGCPEPQPAAQPGGYRAVVTVDGGGSAVLGWTRTFAIE